MHLDLEHFTEPELKSLLDKYLRLFDVAYGSLQRLSTPHLDAEAMRKDAAETLKIIDSYPNHPRFTVNPSEIR